MDHSHSYDNSVSRLSLFNESTLCPPEPAPPATVQSGSPQPEGETKIKGNRPSSFIFLRHFVFIIKFWIWDLNFPAFHPHYTLSMEVDIYRKFYPRGNVVSETNFWKCGKPSRIKKNSQIFKSLWSLMSVHSIQFDQRQYHLTRDQGKFNCQVYLDISEIVIQYWS